MSRTWKNQELLEQALEALQQCAGLSHAKGIWDNTHAAITALEQAIEAPADEPCCWGVSVTNYAHYGTFAEHEAKAKANHCGGTCEAFPLYKGPQ